MMTTKRTLILLGRILLLTTFLILFIFSIDFLHSTGQDHVNTVLENFGEMVAAFFTLSLSFFATNEWMRTKNKVHKPFPYFLWIILIPVLVSTLIFITLNYLEGREKLMPPMDAFLETSFLTGIFSLFLGFFHYLKYNYKTKIINQGKVAWRTYAMYKKVLLYALGLSTLYMILMAPFFSKFGSFSLKDISIMFIMSAIVAFICWHLVVFFNKLFEQKVSFSGLLATTTIGTFIVIQCLASLFSYFVLVFNHGYDETTKFYNLTDQLTHIGSDSIFIIFSALFYQFLYFSETRATEKKQFKAEIGKQTEKYESLRRQLSPHFLFNNINVLTGLIEENPEKAVHFSESLGNIYRHFLRQEDQDVVSLQSALTFSKDYLELLKYRYEEAFQYVLPKKVDSNHYIIPLALQQVIENVIKHNEISNEMPLQITIGIQNDYLIVQNTKQLKTVIEATKGTGIENIKTRYAYLTEKEVSVQDSVNSFTIKLPLLNMENA